MAVILDKESTISMFSVLSCGHGSHLVHVDNNHLSYYSALLYGYPTKFLCPCTSFQPKTFRVLALAFFNNCLTFNNDAKSQALLYHGLYLELDVLSSIQTN